METRKAIATLPPSNHVRERARQLLNSGAVERLVRCSRGLRAMVRGSRDDLHAVTVTPTITTCTCRARVPICAHVGAAVLAAPARTSCEYGSRASCWICYETRATEPVAVG